MKIETIAIHAGHKPDEATGAIAPPIYLTTTFEREKSGNYDKGYMYTRSGNPNRQQLEECLAQLEGGTQAAAFSSGSAATMSIFQALEPGDHVIVPSDVYHGTSHLLKSVLSGWHLEYTFADTTNLDEVSGAMQSNTKLVFVETPSNPLLQITDLKEVSLLAKKNGALCICDNTWATPVLQRPFDYGVDLIMHSSTKYMGGHSDVLGGAVITRQDNDFFKRIRNIQESAGAVPSPFDSWLVLRGIQTLPYRMRGHCENARKVAEFLEQHATVQRVNYPGLKHHPGHQIASKQMSGFGGMISFQVEGSKVRAMEVVGKTHLFKRATSLGGVESLIEHRASVEGPDTTTPDNLIRISVGLEHSDDLIRDLELALK